MNSKKKQGKDFSDTLKEKEFSEATRTQEEELLQTKKKRQNFHAGTTEDGGFFAIAGTLTELGYKGDPEDDKAISMFLINYLVKEDKLKKQKEKELKSLPVYYKQITTASQEKGKLYTTKGKKDNRPDKEVNPARAVKGKMAIDTDIFYPVKKNGTPEKAIYQANRNLDANTSKLWDYATTKLADQTHYKGKNSEERFKATINIKEYFSLINEEYTQENINKFIKKINYNYANALRSIIIIEPKCKLAGDVHIFSNVLYDKKKVHEEIYVYFFPPYAKFLTSQGHGKIKHIPDALYKIIDDDTYHIGSKLLDNYGQIGNRQKGGHYNFISVQILFYICQTLSQRIDTMKQVKDRHYSRNIIEPFQSKMNNLVDSGILKNWSYTTSKKYPKTEGCFTTHNVTNLDTFKRLNITYKVNNHPLDIEQNNSSYLAK